MNIDARAVSTWATLASIIFVVSACDEPQAEQTATPPQVSIVTLQPSPRPESANCPAASRRPGLPRCARACPASSSSARSSRAATSRPATCSIASTRSRSKSNSQAAEAALAKAQAVLDQAEQQAERIETLIAGPAPPRRRSTRSRSRRSRQARGRCRRRARPTSRAPSSISTIRAYVRRSTAASAARWSPKARWSARAKPRIWRPSSSSIPIYADFTQSVGELQQLRRASKAAISSRSRPTPPRSGSCSTTARSIRMPGKLLFSDATVDPSTGQVTLRGEFPNPKRELLPGMYVRVQIEQGIDTDALAVPQQAIQRNDGGGSEVYVVRRRTTARVVAAGPHRPRASTSMWLVSDGPEGRRPRRRRRLPEIRARRHGQAACRGSAIAPTALRVRCQDRRVTRALTQRSLTDRSMAELLHRPADLRLGGRAVHLPDRRDLRFRCCRSRNIRSSRRPRSRSRPAIPAPRRRTSTTASRG